MGRTIYITDKEAESISTGADAIRTNCESASEEYCNSHEDDYLNLENVFSKYLKAKKSNSRVRK